MPFFRTRWLFAGLLAASLDAQSTPAPERVSFDDLVAQRVRYRIDTPRVRWVDDGTVLEVLRPMASKKEKLLPARHDPRTWGPIERRAARDAEVVPATPARRVGVRDGQIVLRSRGRPDKPLTKGPLPKREAHLSPDQRWVSYVSGGNLLIQDLEAGAVWPVSDDGSETRLYGVLDWVYQEEVYGRGDFQAHWWSPDSAQVAFLALDESAVRDFTIVDHAPARVIAEDRTVIVERTKYPKAGDPNPTVRLGIAAPAARSTAWVDLSKYPDDALIVRVGWTPTGDRVVFQVQDRVQSWLELASADPATGEVEPILRETSRSWVEVHGQPRWLTDGSFVWASDRTGTKQLYRYSIDGALLGTITTGDTPVRRIVRIDEERGLVWYTAAADSPLGEHLFRVGLDGGAAVQLTRGRGVHRVELSADGSTFVDTVSTANTPPEVRICDGDGEVLRTLESTHEPFEFALCPTELHVIEARDGWSLDVSLIKPPEPIDGAAPVWIETYSGPAAPSVRDQWRVSSWHQFLAHQGIVVMQVNVRSASNAGHAAVSSCHRQFGVQELRDLEDAVTWVTAHDWADADRVGMTGWSYGGFMTAYALTHSRKFRVGIAGAGVYDWQLYDTIYTERYMGTPQGNPDGYRKSSCIDAAKDLHGYLVLVHGTIDDNVHAQNTIRFAGALQDAGKDFEMMLYPNSRHGVRSKHLRQLRWKIIRRELLGV